MKKILFVIPSFEIGGTIVSLYSLLSIIDKRKVEVEIFARSHVGSYRNKLPNCKVLQENVWLSSTIREDGAGKRFVCLFLKFVRNFLKLFRLNLYSVYGRIGGLIIQSDKYDAVISYQEDLTRIVSYYPAKKIIAWVHCDYERYLSLLGNVNEDKYYQRVDTVVCVSNFAKSVFCKMKPQFAEKTITIYNIINIESILSKSLEEINIDPLFDTSCFTIVSVGRVDPVKQFILIPEIAAKVKKEINTPFKWYIIGRRQGNAKSDKELVDNIKKYNMEDNVFWLSEKINIYPYMSKANLYVNTSLSESFSLVVHEARVLNVPVIINDIGIAHEVVNDGIDGFIVPIEEMHKQISEFIVHPRKIVFRPIDNVMQLNKFMSMLS